MSGRDGAPLRVAPLLLGAVGLALLVALAVALLRPGVWALVLLGVAVLLPGRWWRWRTRRFRRGQRALEAGEARVARREFEAFLEETEGDGRFRRLQPLFNLGRPYPYRAAAVSNLGVAALQEGRPEEALERFRRALAEAPGHAQAKYGEAAALRLLGRLEEAERAAERALEERPRYVAARALLGLVRDERGDREAARRALAPLEDEDHDARELVERLRAQWPLGE